MLDAWLLEQNYCQLSREGIAAHIRQHGELSGAVPVFLDREDEATATDVFDEALPAVPTASHEWGSPTGQESRHNPLDDRWFPLDTIRAVPPEMDSEDWDDPDTGEDPNPDHRPDVTHFDPTDQPDPDFDDPRWGDTRIEAPETVPPLSPAEIDALPDPAPDDRWSRDLASGSGLVTIAIPAPISGGALADDQVMDDDPMAFPAPRPDSRPQPTRNRYSPEAIANIRRMMAEYDRR